MFNSFSSSGYIYANRQPNSNATVSFQNALTNFNVVGVGINCFTFTWTTPTFAVTQYNLKYNDGTILNIPASNITRNIQYGYSGFTLKNITITNPFHFNFGSNATSSITKTVSNIQAYNLPTTYTTSTINSFTQTIFTTSVTSFTLPTTSDGSTISTAAVILVGRGGNGGSPIGTSAEKYSGGGGSGGGVAFYPLFSSYSATPSGTFDISINTLSTTFHHTLQSVLCGKSGGPGPNHHTSRAQGGASISTSVNNVTFISGIGGVGDSNRDAGPNTDGVSIIIPELDISYNFSGGGSGGNIQTTIAFLDPCLLRSRIYGCGVGGSYNKTGSTGGTANTGGGGAGISRQTPNTTTGGSGVVYLYYSTYYFTVH